MPAEIVNPKALPDRRDLYLSDWCIGDGEYPVLRVGEIVEYGLEFSTPGTEDSIEFAGTCILQTSELTGIDIGVVAYRYEDKRSTDSTFREGEPFRNGCH